MLEFILIVLWKLTQITEGELINTSYIEIMRDYGVMENMDMLELQQIVSVCLDEIIRLKEDNHKIEEKLRNTTESIKGLLQMQKDHMENDKNVMRVYELQFQEVLSTIENLKYEFNDPEFDASKFYFPQFYDIKTTIEDIVKNRSSMARFGDGEFAIMSNIKRPKFQCPDEKLAARLKEVIASHDERMLIAIADNYGSLELYNSQGKRGIRLYMSDKTRQQHIQFLDVNRRYHNAYISRPYVLFSDNHTDAPKERFKELKRIWDGRDVIFVEGTLTRLGQGNDLFDNTCRIRRIQVPPENAYDKYDEILNASLKYAEKDTLFLIAMGPAAGVLAYDLYQAGYQAIDIGHVDLEYEWFLQGKGCRCEVKHKYNNEVFNGDIVEDVKDEEYLRQILCRI